MKAPSVAEYLVQEILNNSRNNSQPEAQGSKEIVSGTNSKRPSKRRRQLDHTYRRPRSSRPQPDISGPGDSDSAVEGRSLVGDDSVTCQPDLDDMTINQSSDSLMIDMHQPLQECEEDILEMSVEQALQEGVQGQSAAHRRTIDSEPMLHPSEATYSSDSAIVDSAHRRPSVVLNESTEGSQTHSPSGAGQRETALSENNGKATDTQTPSAPPLII